MTTLYCAICGNRFEPDDDHMWIDAERKPRTCHPASTLYEADGEFAFHVDCWERETSGWRNPT